MAVSLSEICRKCGFCSRILGGFMAVKHCTDCRRFTGWLALVAVLVVLVSAAYTRRPEIYVPTTVSVVCVLVAFWGFYGSN